MRRPRRDKAEIEAERAAKLRRKHDRDEAKAAKEAQAKHDRDEKARRLAATKAGPKQRAAQTLLRAAVAGHQKVVEEERAAAAREAQRLTARARRGKGKRKEKPPTEAMYDSQGTLSAPVVKGFGRGRLEPHQRAAADAFERDWNQANGGLRSPGFEPAVDGGGMKTGAELVRASALTRVSRIKEFLGERKFTILVGSVILGIGPKIAHANGAGQDTAIMAEIRVILNEVSGFYSPGRTHLDPMWETYRKLVLEAERVTE